MSRVSLLASTILLYILASCPWVCAILGKVEVLVRESSIAKGGLGLYLNPLEEDVVVPQHSIVCSYAKGRFYCAPRGNDKCVGYEYTDLESLCVFEDRVMRLHDLVQSHASAGNPNLRMWGHSISASCNKIEIVEVFESVFFLPDNDDISSEEAMKGGRIGQFANDLAFRPCFGLYDDDAYYSDSEEMNDCNLAWDLGFDKHRQLIFPKSPVVITRRELALSSSCKEVGIEYGFAYWRVFLREKLQLRKPLGFWDSSPLLPVAIE